MAQFKINELEQVSRWVEAEERLWLTADRERIVAEGDPEAAFLYASPGKRIDRLEAVRYGLVKRTKDDEAALADQAAGASDEATGGDDGPDATESAVAFAAEHGVDLTEVTGSGKGGRVTQGDVQAFVKARDAEAEG